MQEPKARLYTEEELKSVCAQETVKTLKALREKLRDCYANAYKEKVAATSEVDRLYWDSRYMGFMESVCITADYIKELEGENETE